MQYERAVQLEAEGMKMAAEGRFEDANEKLVVCVMMHQQLLGQRHPQLIRPYLAAAENSAKWGDSLGLQGKEQVKKAQEYVDNALLILDSMPLSSKELMGEEELRLIDMRTVLAQMLDALSPPEELMASSRRGPILLPELPDAVNLLEEGRSVYLNLTRERPWAFHAATVREGWMHAQTLVGRDSKMMVYGIQTVTTAMAVTQDARLRLHAVLAASGSGGAGWIHGDGSRERCRWWNDAQCLEELSSADFAMSGDQGVGLGRDSMTKSPAPAWMHFMELPSDVGSVALLGAEMDPPSHPPLSLTLLTVNEEPMVPLHLGDGLQTWELDGFRASVHYLTWTEETQLHRLQIVDKACRMMSDARVLFSWGSIPMTTLANVRSARACLHTQGLTTEFLPSGCWRNGAKDGDMLFVVIINPCSAPSTITMKAEFHTQGGAPAASRPSPREAASEAPGSSAPHSKPHAHTLEISARQHYAMQLHGQGVFVRAPEPQPMMPGWLSMIRQLPARAWKPVRQVGLLGAAVVFALLAALVLAGRASLRRKAKPGSLRPPSQRGGGRSSSNQTGSAAQPRGGGHDDGRPRWLRWLPTLSELSGTRPKARRDPSDAETTYEINIRRGRVSVSAVQQRRPSTANSASPRRPGPSSPRPQPGAAAAAATATSTAVPQRQENMPPHREGSSEDITRASGSGITSNTTRSRAHRGSSSRAGAAAGSRSQGNSPSGSARGSRERISSMPPSPAATGASVSPTASPLRPPQPAPHDPPELSSLAHRLLGSTASDDEEPLPDMYQCPITQEVMRDPVFASDGYTYERDAIEDWLKVKRTSPMTNLPFDSPMLVPNNALRSAILEALERRGRMQVG